MARRDNTYRFSLRYLILAVVTIGAVLGWYSARIECRKLEAILESEYAQKSVLLTAASIEAASILNFHDIVGKPIENYPLFQTLAITTYSTRTSNKDWHQDPLKYASEKKYLFPDRFGNSPEEYRKLEAKKEVVSYHLTLAELNLKTEGDRHQTITIFVQDGVIRLVLEEINILSL